MTHASINYPSSLPPILDVLLLIGLCVLVLAGARMPNIERALGSLASMLGGGPGRSVIVVAITATALHLLSLLWIGTPRPWVTDEHAYLLGADTFAHGRLTNPLPILDAATDPQFEEAHVLTAPTRQSKYPPGQSLILGLGQLLGAPWVALPLLVFLLTASIGWALLGSLPPALALLGTSLIGVWVGVGSYWSHSYWGGCLAATAGAWVFGAVTRLVGKHQRPGALGVVCGLGLGILALSRPYEGLVFSLPCGLAALWWMLRNAGGAKALRWTLGTAAGVSPGLLFLAIYNRAVTGSATRLPHHIYTEQTFEVKPHFLWFDRPFAEFVALFAEQFVLRASTATWHLLGAPLSVLLWISPLLWLRYRRLDTQGATHPTVFLGLVCTVAVFGAQASVVPWFPHYPAPLTVALLVLALFALQKLRGVVFLGRTWHRAMPAIVLICALIGCVVRLPAHRSDPNSDVDAKAGAFERLQAEPGTHIVFAPTAAPDDGTWTHNGAEPLAQKVLWARSIDRDTDLGLARRLGRMPWRADLYSGPPRVVPYQ